MAALYAEKHPEVSYKDIGITLGYKLKTAKAMVSVACKRHNITKRKHGAGSLSYDRSAIVTAQSTDRVKMAELLNHRPYIPYADIAKQMGVCYSTIVDGAKELGLSRGQLTRRKHTDEEIIAYFTANPSGSIRKALIALGYSPKGSTTEIRLRRLRKKARGQHE